MIIAEQGALVVSRCPLLFAMKGACVPKVAFEVFNVAQGEFDPGELRALWERSVRATHHFVSEADIVAMRPEVTGGLAFVEHVAIAREFGPNGEHGRVLAFAGAHEGNLEMLFCDADARGIGVGQALLRHAIDAWGVITVDVNEQNGQAVGFYKHEGFAVTSRDALDSEGRPYPILHMELGRCGAVLA